MTRFLAAAALALALPMSASANEITIRFNANMGPSDYWCAAAKHFGRLGATATTRIYVTSPLPRPRGQGVTFSTVGPSSGDVPGWTGNLISRIDTLKLHQAGAQCDAFYFPDKVSEGGEGEGGGEGGNSP